MLEVPFIRNRPGWKRKSSFVFISCWARGRELYTWCIWIVRCQRVFFVHIVMHFPTHCVIRPIEDQKDEKPPRFNMLWLLLGPSYKQMQRRRRSRFVQLKHSILESTNIVLGWLSFETYKFKPCMSRKGNCKIEKHQGTNIYANRDFTYHER